METSLSVDKFEDVKNTIGEPSRKNLVEWLHALNDPYEAVKKEVETIKKYSFVPETLSFTLWSII